MVVWSVITILFGVLCSAFVMTALGTAILPPDRPEQTPETDFCAAAYNSCLFKFLNQNTVPTYDLSGTAMEAFTGPIVMGDEILFNTLDTEGVVPEFLFEDEAKEITSYGEPPFSSTHFKSVPIKDGRTFGIAHEEFMNDQLSFAENRCIRIFITSFEIPSHRYEPRIVNFSERRENCVVFRTS